MTTKTTRDILHETALKAPLLSGVYLWKNTDGTVIYVGKAKNKYTFLGERDTSKLKATMEYNFGTNIQYKDADQYALTLGINYTHHGKLQFDETSSKLQKAYGQVSTELSANVKVASNIYTNLSWQHQFDTALKDSDGKMGDLSGDLIGLGATFKF